MGQDVAIIAESPFKWQTKMNAIIASKPHDRYIYWIYDPMGNKGKSKYAKYLCYNEKAHLLSWDDPVHLFQARKKNKHINCVVFDLTRSMPAKIDLNGFYSAIEQIKNGLMFSPKYESEQVTTAVPHILIFSNSLPKHPDAISLDRWQIMRLLYDHEDIKHMSEEEIDAFMDEYSTYELNKLLFTQTKQAIMYSQIEKQVLRDQLASKSDFELHEPDFSECKTEIERMKEQKRVDDLNEPILNEIGSIKARVKETMSKTFFTYPYRFKQRYAMFKPSHELYDQYGH